MSGSENSMPEPRPAASLTAGLLARRGTARPAMRRPTLSGLHAPLPTNDDLGWNDMGEPDRPGEEIDPVDSETIASAPVALRTGTQAAQVTEEEAARTPDDSMTAERASAVPATEALAPASPAPVSPIEEQLQALAKRINARTTPRKAESRSPAKLTEAARKAAFTLRIDQERHLRLRLLSAVSNRSAQQLLIEALDTLITENEQLNALARQVEARRTASRGK